jgi:GNAT superfamily N-acetyltransferase
LDERGEETVALVREADESDNDSLNELQKKSPMGTKLVLGVDSSPDYFARSRTFQDWHVYVAVDDDKIVGSAAVAIKDTCFESREVKAAYEYGFIVDPLHRRRGIAERLQKHIEQVATNQGVGLLHVDIIEDNIPSLNLFSKMGFARVRDCVTISLMPYKREKITDEGRIRTMKEADIDLVTGLLNQMYNEYDFFTPFEHKDFVEYLGRIPHFDFSSILVFENGRKVEACLGIWEYDKIRKYIVEKMNWKLNLQTRLMRTVGLFREVPYIPKPGEPLRSYNIATPACNRIESMNQLLKKAVNIALDNSVNFIHATMDPSCPLASAVSSFKYQTTMKLYVLTKFLGQRIFKNSVGRRVYVDVTET